MPEARRPRRPARTATNPYGRNLDPRHGDLPYLMGENDGTNVWRTRLAAATADYTDISNTLRSSVASLEEQFGPAFAAEDARRATQDRINRAARADDYRKAEERRLRNG